MRAQKRIKKLQVELLESRRKNVQALVERNEAREELAQAREEYAVLSAYRDKLRDRLEGQIAPYTILVHARSLWSEFNDPAYNQGVLELAQEILAQPIGSTGTMKLLARDFISNPGLRRSIINPRPGDHDTATSIREGLKRLDGDTDSSESGRGEGPTRGDEERGGGRDLPRDQEADA